MLRDHAIDLLACFFDSQAQANDVVGQLKVWGAPPDRQIIVLGPEQAGRRQFSRLARSWSRGRDADSRPWYADPPLVSACGGILTAVVSATAFLLDPGLSDGREGLALMLLPLAGMALSWTAAAVLPAASSYQMFDATVRGQLMRGRWVVLAHHVPWANQATLFGQMQARALAWCEAGARRHAL